MIGIIVGTYSSVFVATPIVVDLTKKTLGAAADKERVIYAHPYASYKTKEKVAFYLF